jgi:predicted dehydrogenase
VAHHPFQGLIRHFLDCIDSGADSDVDVAGAVRVHEVCFAALLSARTGRPVALPLTGEDRLAIERLLAGEQRPDAALV